MAWTESLTVEDIEEARRRVEEGVKARGNYPLTYSKRLE